MSAKVLALTDHQLDIVISALRKLPTEQQRSIFLRLVDEQLRARTVDVQDATVRALQAVTDDA